MLDRQKRIINCFELTAMTRHLNVHVILCVEAQSPFVRIRLRMPNTDDFIKFPLLFACFMYYIIYM